MRVAIRIVFWSLALTMLSALGCAYHPSPDPNLPVMQSLNQAVVKLDSAGKNLDTKPPKVDAARDDVKNARGNVVKAIEQTQDASVEYQKLVKVNEDQAKELDQFFSRRQRHLFWWSVVLIGLFGTLAAVGEFFPGWWSLPALWLMKGLRLLVFGGIPHLVKAAVWIIKRIKG